MGLVIHDAHLKFSGAQRRRLSTQVIVIHHSGESVPQSVEVIHDYYLHRTDPGGATYIGIAYHYYVRRDGGIYKGREEWAIGGHAGPTANPISIGICFEGDYEHTSVMPGAQLEAGEALLRDIMSRYGHLTVKRHKDYMNTDCPGRNFPFEQMVSAANGGATATAAQFPGTVFFGAGADNAYIPALKKALAAHGYGGGVKDCAATKWSNDAQQACVAFQRAQGWSGGGADGIPGPETWRRLGL